MGLDFAYIAAWLLPAFVGGGIWMALSARARWVADIPAAIGAGWLIGLFVAAGCARLAAFGDTAHAFSRAWPWYAAIGVGAWIAAIARVRRMPPESPPRVEAFSVAFRALWWLLLAWIAFRFAVIGDEASLRPVFPWDAWSAWSTKPKTWFLTGHVEPYVSMLNWLANPDQALRTAASWSYPELLAWVQLWFASAAGAWNEPLVDVAWCGALMAFSFAAYGYWRALGLAAWIALALVYGLVSLPLIDAHVALAGYADLWVALTLGLATLAWTRWLTLREPRQLALATAIALCLPLLKLEGMVWFVAFCAVVAFDLVPPRRRRLALLCIPALLIVGALVAGFAANLQGESWIEIPSIGSFALAWHGVGGAMVASLFTLPNWHLLWYIIPVLLFVRRARFREDRAARMIGLMLLIDFGFLFALFFLTTASAWAQDFTSANRLILQLVPSVFVLAAVLLRPMADPSTDVSVAIRRRAQANAARTVPA
ncbi:MAG TPA: hypothetical protein VGO25_01075 [Rhodanobacteraceae bacterium]|nr:hypothetical protein [Rhodanobacteraceae bacterium]